MTTRKGLTEAMIEALRRAHRDVDLNADPGVLFMTCLALQERGLLEFKIDTEAMRIVDVRVTAAGLAKLMETADVKLSSWRLVP
jgi:hypothetical protein